MSFRRWGEKMSNAYLQGNIYSNIDFITKSGILNKKIKILEIGSGNGNLLNYLYKEGYNICGIEINEIFIKNAKEEFGEDLPIYYYNGEILSYKENSFDVILSFDVFEHIKNTNKHLSEVRRILKPGGFYLFCTPNKITNAPYEIWWTKSLTSWKKEHCSLHSYWNLKKRLSLNNFNYSFVDIKVTNEYLINKLKRRLGILGVILYKIFNPDRMPFPLKTNFYVIAKSNKE